MTQKESEEGDEILSQRVRNKERELISERRGGDISEKEGKGREWKGGREEGKGQDRKGRGREGKEKEGTSSKSLKQASCFRIL